MFLILTRRTSGITRQRLIPAESASLEEIESIGEEADATAANIDQEEELAPERSPEEDAFERLQREEALAEEREQQTQRPPIKRPPFPLR